MALAWPPKDPDEVLDYTVDWSARLDAGDSIATSSWTLPSGITQNSASKTGTTTTIWLSAGVIGATYLILNRIVTVLGRTMDQTIKLKIKSK